MVDKIQIIILRGLSDIEEHDNPRVKKKYSEDLRVESQGA